MIETGILILHLTLMHIPFCNMFCFVNTFCRCAVHPVYTVRVLLDNDVVYELEGGKTLTDCSSETTEDTSGWIVSNTYAGDCTDSAGSNVTCYVSTSKMLNHTNEEFSVKVVGIDYPANEQTAGFGFNRLSIES